LKYTRGNHQVDHIDWSIGECRFVDRTSFCIDLTRYLKRTFFNQSL